MTAERGKGRQIAAAVGLFSLAAVLVVLVVSLWVSGLQDAANVAQLVTILLVVAPLTIELVKRLRRPPLEATPQTERPTGKNQVLLLRGAAALVVLAFIGATVWVARTSGSEPPLPPPPAGSTDLRPVPTDGVRCDPFSNPAVAIESIAATDGEPGIATFNTLRLNVLRTAPSEYTYWIIAHLFRTDGNPYIAKAQVRSNTGAESHELQFKDAVGSVRDIYIVEADPAGTEQLRQNNATQLDGSQDATRQQPPPGQVVSMTCHVTKTRS